MFTVLTLPLLLQTTAPADTVLARIVPERGFFDYAHGILEVIVLVLAVVLLATLIWVALTVRKVIVKMEEKVHKLTSDANPIIKDVTQMSGEARRLVSRLSADAERVTDAAAKISDQLLDAADVTARRIDEVNAVLDVVQNEIEEVAISSVSTMRGVRVGARELGAALTGQLASNGGHRVTAGLREELAQHRDAMRASADELELDDGMDVGIDDVDDFDDLDAFDDRADPDDLDDLDDPDDLDDLDDDVLDEDNEPYPTEDRGRDGRGARRDRGGRSG